MYVGNWIINNEMITFASTCIQNIRETRTIGRITRVELSAGAGCDLSDTARFDCAFAIALAPLSADNVYFINLPLAGFVPCEGEFGVVR